MYSVMVPLKKKNVIVQLAAVTSSHTRRWCPGSRRYLTPWRLLSRKKHRSSPFSDLLAMAAAGENAAFRRRFPSENAEE